MRIIIVCDKESIPLQDAKWRTTTDAICVSCLFTLNPVKKTRRRHVSCDSNFTAHWLWGETTVIYFYTSYFI